MQQAIESAPRWLIKKLTATYLTLGLSEIGKEVGIASEDDTRKVVLDMVSFMLPQKPLILHISAVTLVS